MASPGFSQNQEVTGRAHDPAAHPLIQGYVKMYQRYDTGGESSIQLYNCGPFTWHVVLSVHSRGGCSCLTEASPCSILCPLLNALDLKSTVLGSKNQVFQINAAQLTFFQVRFGPSVDDPWMSAPWWKSQLSIGMYGRVRACVHTHVRVRACTC